MLDSGKTAQYLSQPHEAGQRESSVAAVQRRCVPQLSHATLTALSRLRYMFDSVLNFHYYSHPYHRRF